MARIFDNIEEKLLGTLRATMEVSKRADFCVGYLNLRGWQAIDDLIEPWSPELGQQCRVLVGMQRPDRDDIRELYGLQTDAHAIDNSRAVELKSKFAADLREQITIGIPSGGDERGMRRLARQLRLGKVVVKLFLPHPLHAKLYLLFRDDVNNPITGFVGSSNLTMQGLSRQGELNVDVLDHMPTQKLAAWFNDRWDERWALDISAELAQLIESSWAREELVPPHHIYLKMAHHLSTEARAGFSQFRLPQRFEEELFEFQKSAVKIAAQHLNRRNGVMIGDVVGLGKTMMATALARMFEDDYGYETLIVCPKNLESMWNKHREKYGLRGRVVPISQIAKEIGNDLKTYRLVLIDESHNLRNREGRRYKAIADYIRRCDSKVILLTATPYNKTKSDLSSQLRLFIDERSNIGIRPERFMRANGLSDADFERKFQCPAKSIAAIEKSDDFDDWRELIRLYMVRRTRSFILQHYTQIDADGRHYLQTHDNERRYFPERRPRSLAFDADETNSADRYARLYSPAVVDTINALHVPRYGLGLYISQATLKTATAAEQRLVENLGRAGKRLMGFCRTNLFKRLESSGYSFLQSLDRHILRNQIFLYAIENGRDLPIGIQDADLIDSDRIDEDADGIQGDVEDLLDGMIESVVEADGIADTLASAGRIYERYAGEYKKRFKWIRPSLFLPSLASDLQADAESLSAILRAEGVWRAESDNKLKALQQLVTKTHGKEKVLVFTQFADTARYLEKQLLVAGIAHIDVATGSSADPHLLACRFSPKSNGFKVGKSDELRVLICTDVLSEGQNLQDCHVVVNYDLPWAIIRLIQRAGRVDRIGQKAEEIFCYSFLPSEGVEKLIQLRERIQQRLRENAEVIGTDEAFFEDEEKSTIRDLYAEQSGILDDSDDEVDLASYAWQIWREATANNPELALAVEALPPVVYSAKHFEASEERLGNIAAVSGAHTDGALVYVKSPEGNDHLAWLDENGNTVTESQMAILKAAACEADTAAVARAENHHDLVAGGLKLAVNNDKSVGGGLGRPSSPRRRAYERLKSYSDKQRGTLFHDEELTRVVDDIYARPLLETGADTLNRLMRSGVNDEELADAAKSLREENKLVYEKDELALREPRVVCSMGLRVEAKN
jgi:superfamily II DNA or RNA helicase